MREVVLSRNASSAFSYIANEDKYQKQVFLVINQRTIPYDKHHPHRNSSFQEDH